jgi:hypothetical protein
MTDPTALVERLVVEVYNRGNLAVIEQLFTPTILFNGHMATIKDVSDAIACLQQLFPGLHVTLDSITAAGDLVAVHWTIHHSPEPSPNTSQGNRHVTRPGLRLLRVADGRIAEVWFNWTALDRLQGYSELHLPDLPARLNYMES